MSKKYKVIYSPAAKDDLRDTARYIIYELKNPQAAKNVTNRIRSAVKSLCKMPDRYSLVDWEPWASMKTHKVPVGNYIIFYFIEDDAATVTVNRIFYAGRDIEHIIQDSDE